MNTMMTKPESEAKIAQMFNKVAPRYDFLNALLSMQQDKRWRSKLLAYIPKNKKKLAHLDVATGTGDVLIQLAGLQNDFDELIGVDISSTMLKCAEEKVSKLDLNKKLSFMEMSAEKILFPQNKFDSLSISFGLRNVIDKENAIKEFYRVLKPGGLLLILEFFEPDNTVLAHLFLLYFHHILPKIGGIFSDKEAYNYLPKSVESFYSAAELKLVLNKTGFDDIEITSFLFGSCRLVKAVKN